MAAMRAATLIFLSAIALAGCRPSGNGEPIRMANDYHERLLALGASQQRDTVHRAIRDNGRICKAVTNTGYQQEYENMRMWVADCPDDRRRYAIFLAPNGQVLVRDCANAEQLNLPACNPLPSPAADPNAPPVVKGAADNAFKAAPKAKE